MPFLLAEILNFQGSTHRIGVGSFSYKNNPIIQSRANSFQKSLYDPIKKQDKYTLSQPLPHPLYQ